MCDMQRNVGVLMLFDQGLCQIPHPFPVPGGVGVSIDWCITFIFPLSINFFTTIACNLAI